MENYGLSKYDWLEQFLALPEAIPSADTFRRVFNPLTQKYLSDAFDVG
ncbi:Mobile element protein [Richelia intracellularis]|nr:Mobile element protein [Richelia intracellularis]